MSDTLPAGRDLPPINWKCDCCGQRNGVTTRVRKGRVEDVPPPSHCVKCGAKAPPVSRVLPDIKIIFCAACGVTYPGCCRTHSPTEGKYVL